MRDEADTPHARLWGWGLLCGIGVIYVAAIGLLLALMWDMRRDISAVSDRLPAAMLEFERAIGFGGLIHNFKNHVLRPEEENYGTAAIKDYATAMKALTELERMASRAGVPIRTEEIRETLEIYRESIGEVYDAHAAGVPITSTDSDVRVGETGALSALRAAHGEITSALARQILKRKTQITVMVAVISLLMLLLPAGAITMLRLKRREERGYVRRIETLNTGLDKQNERLAMANYALSVTNAELSEFTHAAAHDLRTPLRGISHEAEYLVEEFGEDMQQEATERLVHIQALCRRLDTVMTLLLRYARLAPPTRLDMVDPKGVIREIEAGMRLRLATAGGSIELETELPVVGCKRFDLGLVFEKLIDNALTYNRSVEKRIAIGFLPRVEIAGERLDDVFYVRDNGIGISPEYHDEIFRMFKRLHHDEAYGPGAGAGLSFVRKIVANYGGIVRLASEPDAGTTVYFSFGRQAERKGDVADQGRVHPVGLQSVGA